MDQIEQYRQQIVENALPHVPFDGWTEALLRQAALEAAIDPGYVRLAFPEGVVDAIAWHSRQADQQMALYIRSLPLKTMKLPEKVRQAVLWRLRQNLPHREAIRKAMVTLSFPTNSATALKLLYESVDTIWYEIGDASTDYNFYTKRMTLAAIYSATLTFWLDDHSENQQDTENFLDRRLRDLRNFGRFKQKLLGNLSTLNPFRHTLHH